MIHIRGLSFRYPTTYSGRDVCALSTINLTIGDGEIVLLTGPSGSGKSTLVRCLNGLIPHTTPGFMEGDVEVAGLNTREHEVSEFASLVGIVFQDPDYQLFSSDIISEIAFGPEHLGWADNQIEQAVYKAMADLDILHLVGRQVDELSWGEKQRVAIASVLATTPGVLVLDEPFSGIDSATAESLGSLLRKLNMETGITIIIAEHRIEWVSGLARRTVVLNDGRVSYDGPPEGSGYQVRVRSENISQDFSLYDLKARNTGVSAVPSQSPYVSPSVVFNGLNYRYPGSHVLACNRIDACFYPGEITMITGPNGSGKSTVIRHMNGLLQPESGSVTVLGKDVKGLTVAEISKNVGVLNQHADYQLFEETIDRELAFALNNFCVPEEEQKIRIDQVIQELNIDHLGRDTPPLSLSAGEKQRVAIGSVLAMNTPVIILDEPTIGLDTRLKEALASVLFRLKEQGKTIIIATHDREFVFRFGDRVILMENGSITEELYLVKKNQIDRQP